MPSDMPNIQEPLTTKLSQLRTLMAAGRWREAVIFAAKFQDLGDHKDRILSAREGYLRPEFQRQLKKNPYDLIADGIEALKERYGA